jgi:DNA-binding CsgD family transcriptional regulator
VHSHLKNIYKKLAVHSKTEAVFEADRRRLL